MLAPSLFPDTELCIFAQFVEEEKGLNQKTGRIERMQDAVHKSWSEATDKQPGVDWEFYGRAPKGDHYSLEIQIPGPPNVVRDFHYQGRPLDLYQDETYHVCHAPHRK